MIDFSLAVCYSDGPLTVFDRLALLSLIVMRTYNSYDYNRK